MKVGCAKGCGYTVEITPEAIKELTELGQDVVVAHDVCPNSADAPKRKYRITTTVYEVVGEGETQFLDKQAQMGDTVEAPTFTEAVEQLGAALQEQWGRIVGMASTIDDPTHDDDGNQL